MTKKGSLSINGIEVEECTTKKTDGRSGMSAENAAVHLLSEANKSWNSFWRNNFGKLPRFRFGLT